MNFSDLFKQTGQLCEYSPNGQLIVNSFLYLFNSFTFVYSKANAAQFRLVVHDVANLQAVNLFTCLDTIQYIEVSSQFSPLSLSHLNSNSFLFQVVTRFRVYSLCFTQT